jgi:hypothetical protein
MARATARYSTRVFGGLNRPTIAAALVVVVALVAPTAALACNGGPSAVNVYKECLPAGGGEKPTSGGQTTTPVSGPVSSRTANALNKAGKDKSRLLSLVKGYGPSRLLQSRSSTAAATDPSALGSAFDLGSGPTTLLALLAGTALLLLATTGLRGLRRRRS